MHELIAPAVASLAAGWLAWLKWRLRLPSRRKATSLGAVREVPALPGADGRVHAWSEVRGSRATVVVFMANRCPGVTAYDARLKRLQEDYADRGVRVVGINPIDEHLYTSETLAEMARAAAERGLGFAYLKDADQAAARAFDAQCTPQVFVLDGRDRLRYRGRIDDAFVESRAKRHYARAALDDVLLDQRVGTPETPPLGCAIDRIRPPAPVTGSRGASGPRGARRRAA